MLSNLFKRDQGISSLNNPNSSIYQALLGLDGGPSYAGPTVNAETAMRISTVFACVNLIGGTLGSLPRKIYRRKKDGSREELRLPGDQFLWGAPNKEMLAVNFWETITGHMLLTGDAYIYTPRNGLGKYSELWPLMPSKVEPIRTADGEKVFRVNGTDVLGPEEVLHIPAFGTNGLRGLSPIAQARQALGLTLAAEEFGAGFFGNGTQLSGILTSDHNLSEDAAKRSEASWKKANTGLKNAWKIAVLEGGLKWQSVGVPPADAQYLELRKFQRSEICAIFGVPPHMIGDVERSTSWGTGIEQQAIGFITYTLLRWLRRVEEAVTTRLLVQEDRYFRFDVAGLLRGSTKERYESYKIAREGGWLSINDILRLEDMPPVAGGDDHLQPLNFAPLGSPAASGETTGGQGNGAAQQ
jgi:HK97 family phage portal protein